MDLNIKEIFIKEKEMAKDYGSLLNKIILKFIRDSILMIEKMDLGFINGPMDHIIKVLLKMIKNMALVRLFTKMANLLFFNGKMVKRFGS